MLRLHLQACNHALLFPCPIALFVMSIYDEQQQASTYTGRVYVRREKLNNGGYTKDGCYFGVGSPLYYISDYDGVHSDYFRASCREEALDKARNIYPMGKVSKC